MPGVNRINTYTDSRFSKKVLNQHGAFLIGDEPYEVEIVSKTDAIIRGKNPNFYESVIENFRFYAEHITNFWDESNNLVKTYPAVELVRISIAEIQPSQFYVDEINDGDSYIVTTNSPYIGAYIDRNKRLDTANWNPETKIYTYTLDEDCWMTDMEDGMTFSVRLTLSKININVNGSNELKIEQ